MTRILIIFALLFAAPAAAQAQIIAGALGKGDMVQVWQSCGSGCVRKGVELLVMKGGFLTAEETEALLNVGLRVRSPKKQSNSRG